MPSAIIVLVFGIFTVIKGGFGFWHGWIIFGIAGIVITALTGSLFLGPELKRIAGIVESRGAEDPEAIERSTRLIRIGRIDLLILILVVIDMVLKPGS